jgi:O-antigen biosynthesis protein WbqV
MGEPVRILDLARQMILLSGRRPDIDIKVEITGPRPGEKLFEEILHDSEPPVPTEIAGIKLAAPRTSDLLPLTDVIDQIFGAARRGADDDVMSLIRHQVPEFQPEAGGPIRAVAS